MTNAVQSWNTSPLKVIRAHRPFPNEEAALKGCYIWLWSESLRNGHGRGRIGKQRLIDSRFCGRAGCRMASHDSRRSSGQGHSETWRIGETANRVLSQANCDSSSSMAAQ